MSTDTSFEGDLLDPSKCSKLSVEQKRELVHQVSKWPNGAAEALQAWSRQDILQVLCAEMGKERKYTGLTKLKIIEQLLKIISEKKSVAAEVSAEQEQQSSPSPRSLKRQRKAENPSRLPVTSSNVPINTAGGDTGTIVYCKNSACKATLSREDRFCKRCSCCICFRYDDNKDPSLWLICSSEPPSHGDSCGMSCHLECALKHEQSGIAIDGRHRGVDGCFSCVSCGKVNDLLGCWRKQLVTARDTRRVDILCYRVALSKKLLKGTEKYRKCYEIVDEAVKKLEADVGPLTGLPAKIGRGIVNRLSTGPEVQKLCAYAVEALDSMLSLTDSHSSPIPARQGSTFIVPDMVRFENISTTSLKIAAFNGTSQCGTCEVRALTSVAADEASDHSVAERSQSPATNCSSLSNPSSVEDESNNISTCDTKMDSQSMKHLSYGKDSEKLVPDSAVDGTGLRQEVGLNEVPLLEENRDIRITGSLPHILNEENKHTQEDRMVEAMNIDNGSNIHARADMECVPFGGSLESALPITPCKLETSRDGPGRIGRLKPSNRDLEIGNGKGDGPQDGSTSKKRSSESRDEECEANAHSDRDFEYCVKKIRWLECEGHIEKNFRQKFLTWYSLRATPQEVRVVKVFIDTLIGDPKSLAEQLIDAFSDCISSKSSSVVPSGFCMKLWH
ncbi:VIN3-like protein 2 isoform X2 [Rhodamnia argentea]|uniref:VIN3-like protein 2 isoform X2 n=1 Tax=Rhodamnia argentea TaxID=178133 RepID=A0A8B8PL53_9MYRT|nr:VIN3-like protein 2 isoform X2 [Rhodamnia argentea]